MGYIGVIKRLHIYIYVYIDIRINGYSMDCIILSRMFVFWGSILGPLILGKFLQRRIPFSRCAVNSSPCTLQNP